MDLNLLLIKQLSGRQVLKSPHIVEAFKKMDRIRFVKNEYKDLAYEDRALPLDAGQTISQPSTVAFMLELLEPKLGDKILDVGSGSGWTTALLAHCVGYNGYVIGVEIMPALLEFGTQNLNKIGIKNARIVPAQKELGYSQEGPYDKILVSAFAKEISYTLMDQLKVGGILVMPVNNELVKVEKIDELNFKIHNHPGFVFVPLIDTENIDST